jgi:hypothetical protein
MTTPPPEAVTAISRIQPGDGRLINVRYEAWTHIVPLPPDNLMWSVRAATVEGFLVLGDARAQLVSRHTPPKSTVLDIGCGCGRTARVLINNRYISEYIGFDVIRCSWHRSGEQVSNAPHSYQHSIAQGRQNRSVEGEQHLLPCANQCLQSRHMM